MNEKTTWETFFDAHAPVYGENVFTKNTLKEVDFLQDCRTISWCRHAIAFCIAVTSVGVI